MADIIFTANAGSDAEIRWTRDQQPVMNVRVCESKSRRLDDGTWETLREQWFDVHLFGPTAEVLAPEIRKGTRVKVAGEVWRRDYEGRNGAGVSLDVNATGVQILPKRDGGRQQQGAGGGFSGGQQQGGQQSGGNDPWGGGQASGGSWGGPLDNGTPPF